MNRDRYLEQRVLSADPVELIQMIYQHALDMVNDARRFLREGDIASRSKAICRAIDALSELEASLNPAQAGNLCQNLAGLYQYMRVRLTAANVTQQDAPMAEVESLLRTLAEGWRAVQGAPAASPQQVEQWRPLPEYAPEIGRFAKMECELTAHEWSA